MPDQSHDFGVVLFYTSSAALRSEKMLIRNGLSAKLIPTPREFSSDCGIALRFGWRHSTQVRELLESAQVDIASIHRLGD